MAIYNNDDWIIGEFFDNGKPIIVRARSSLPTEADRVIYSHLILVTWPYEQTESGMPGSDEHVRMQQFEDALEVGLEGPATGVQAVAITGNGTKEWRYYAYDTNEFMEALNRSLLGHEPYPIDLQVFQDPEWNALAEMIPAKS